MVSDAERDVIDRLRRCRIAAGLTQADVAARMRISRVAVSLTESCRRSPTLNTLVRYADAVGAELWVMGCYEHDRDAVRAV